MSVVVNSVSFEDDPGFYMKAHVSAAKTIKENLQKKCKDEQVDLLKRLKSYKGDKTRVLATYVLLSMHIDGVEIPSLDYECLVDLAKRKEEEKVETLRVVNVSFFRRWLLVLYAMKLEYVLAVTVTLLIAIIVNLLI